MTDQPTRYAAAHRHPIGAGDARPTALEIVQDNDRTSALSNLVILITGCSSGLGVGTARALATTGATLYLTARTLTKAHTALGAELLSNPKVHLLHLDLDSLTSVRACAQDFLSRSPQLNILINNAGIRHTPFALTHDVFERQLAVNHLSHFLLTNLLLPTLQASSTMEFQSRVVAVSSGTHRNSPIEFNDLSLERTGIYTPAKGYAQSKLANIYMTSEITRRYGSSDTSSHPGVNGYAIMSGVIRRGLQNQSDGNPIPEFLRSWYMIHHILTVKNMLKSPQQGAATTVLATIGTRFEGKGELHMEDCEMAKPVRKGWGLLDGGYVPGHTDIEDDARKLWGVSCRAVGVEDDKR